MTLWSKRNPCMIEEALCEARSVCDSLETGTESVGRLGDFVGTMVGHLCSFDVAPHALGRVEVRSVSGKPFHLQPVALLANVVGYKRASVCRQAVPDEDDGLALDEAFEFLEKADNAFAVVAALQSAGEQSRLLPVPLVSDGRGNGHFRPVVPPRLQDGCLAFRSPASADGRLLGESSFVLEEQPGAEFRSFFFNSGQRTSFQY